MTPSQSAVRVLGVAWLLVVLWVVVLMLFSKLAGPWINKPTRGGISLWGCVAVALGTAGLLGAMAALGVAFKAAVEALSAIDWRGAP
jgi:hypothetical protein